MRHAPDKRASKKGRPRELKSNQFQLVLALDEMVEEYLRRGLSKKAARRCAFTEMKAGLETETARGQTLSGTRRGITMETLERYYRQGVRELREGEMRLAREVDKVASKEGLQVALTERGDYGAGGILRRRYARGKRALSAASKGAKSLG